MVIAGLSGGLDGVEENRFGVLQYAFHDSACALLENGEIKAAIEEERLNRIKHTNKYPRLAFRFCLEQAGVSVKDLDYIAFGVRESYLDGIMASRYAMMPSTGLERGRQFLQNRIEDDFGFRMDTERFRFVNHHFAHACSAYYPSGFDQSLVVTADGVGDALSGSVYLALDNKLELLQTFSEQQSLGFFYLSVTRYLGYDLFDEYKVMGLAPYGDGLRFSSIFKKLYELLPNGQYMFHVDRLNRLSDNLPKRHISGGFSQTDKDVAMSAQMTLQTIFGHVLEHYHKMTGMENLCLAGGVALNCSMNGDVLQRKMFRQMFVQPASHDAGIALGAALHIYHEQRKENISGSRIRNVYWGGHCGSDKEVETLLYAWDKFVVGERVDDPCSAGAQMMSEGTVIGWVQGRSEFGPRALGNRSILADPRPADHKDVINALVKKREGFRPFAPSVLDEFATEFFDLPENTKSFPFMLFTMPVREKYRPILQAITHVDGSARLQTVSRQDNEQYWRLINCFRELTGIPILLNTSFNNYAEPIVETAADSLVCFLTTGLHALVIGNWVVRKKPASSDALLSLKAKLPRYTKLGKAPMSSKEGRHEVKQARWWNISARLSKHHPVMEEKKEPSNIISNTFDARVISVGDDVFQMLLLADGHQSLAELMAKSNDQRDPVSQLVCLSHIQELWERRFISLSP